MRSSRAGGLALSARRADAASTPSSDGGCAAELSAGTDGAGDADAVGREPPADAEGVGALDAVALGTDGVPGAAVVPVLIAAGVGSAARAIAGPNPTVRIITITRRAAAPTPRARAPQPGPGRRRVRCVDEAMFS